MSKEVYKELLEVMKKRGGRWSGMDIPEFYEMVEELFTPEEAEVNNAFPNEPVTAKDIATKMGRNEEEIEKILESMTGSDLPEVDLDLCFGCAVCASDCPESAIVITPKPGFSEPPKDGKTLGAAIKAASN